MYCVGILHPCPWMKIVAGPRIFCSLLGNWWLVLRVPLGPKHRQSKFLQGPFPCNSHDSGQVCLYCTHQASCRPWAPGRLLAASVCQSAFAPPGPFGPQAKPSHACCPTWRALRHTHHLPWQPAISYTAAVSGLWPHAGHRPQFSRLQAGKGPESMVCFDFSALLCQLWVPPTGTHFRIPSLGVGWEAVHPHPFGLWSESQNDSTLPTSNLFTDVLTLFSLPSYCPQMGWCHQEAENRFLFVSIVGPAGRGRERGGRASLASLLPTSLQLKQTGRVPRECRRIISWVSWWSSLEDYILNCYGY